MLHVYDNDICTLIKPEGKKGFVAITIHINPYRPKKSLANSQCEHFIVSQHSDLNRDLNQKPVPVCKHHIPDISDDHKLLPYLMICLCYIQWYSNLRSIYDSGMVSHEPFRLIFEGYS